VTAQHHASEEWHRQWVAALYALELDVEATAALLEDDHRSRDIPAAEPWRPPTGLGPLPADLRPRAEAIMARQLVLAEALTRTLTANRRQAALAARVQTNTGHPTPAYLDTAA
jgi:hypothetical protein